MAVIDTFLKLLVAQRAERLVLVPEEVPVVVKAEKSIRLAMPAVPADLVRRLSLEVIGVERSGDLAGECALEGTYRTSDGEVFTYEVRAQGAECRIEMSAVVPDEEPAATLGTDRGTGPDAIRSPRESTGEAHRNERSATGGSAGPRPDPEALPVIESAVHADASDIFLSSGKAARMRLNGVIRPLDSAPVTDAQILELIPDERSRCELDSSGNVDFGVRWVLSGKKRRFRINVFRHANGLAAALRPIRARIPLLEELHLPADLRELCAFPSGLVLVTGASGSGKSTTLAALVEHVNQSRARHIITIEDPIEFEHRDDKSLIHQRELGADVESFSTGLRAALRENPDVILLGEMRDLPTISAALTAAETGHLVLSTLHTGSATAAVSRVVDVFPGHQQAHVRVQLAASLRAVVAQRLVPSMDGAGRLPALEKLIVNAAVANSIRDGHEHHMRSAMQTGAEEGMITLERSLAALERRGQISRETAFHYAMDREAMAKFF